MQSQEIDHKQVADRFVSKVKRLAAEREAPLVVFGISLKARQDAERWRIVEQNLSATLNALAAQTDQNFIVVIAGHDKPNLGKFAKFVCWLEADWPVPTEPTQYSNDKQKKRRLILSGLRRAELENFYFFTLDADDFLAPEVCGFVRADDNRSGYYIDRGYLFDASTGKLAALSAKSVPFYKHCGSCAAFWITASDLPKTYRDSTTIWHRLLDHTSYPETCAAMGRPLKALPFYAGLYFLNHGASNVQEKGTSGNKSALVDRFRVEDPKKIAKILRAFAVSQAVGARSKAEGTEGSADKPRAERRSALVVRFSESGRVKQNWGDKLNRHLAEILSRQRVYNSNESGAPKGAQTYLCIGSSLRTVGPSEIVWGTGYISQEDRIGAQPRRICAVRGPNTRRRLIEQGFECPETFGDPALLFPLFYKPPVAASYDYGIIPHFKDRDTEVMPTCRTGATYRIIDIMGGIEQVVDEILSCRQILSSSLHGIIAAHAYGVPATWIKFGDRPMGDGFKFQDYWASVGVENVQPVMSLPGAFCEDLQGPDRPVAPLVDPVRLIESCPFIDPKVRETILQRLAADGLGLLTA